MNDRDRPSPLQGLEQRIKDAKARHERRLGGKTTSSTTSGLGLGLRIATEMVSALAVGVGIGLILDTWLGTQPWMLILFFILGSAAAFVNLIRVAKDAEARRKADEERERRDGNGA